MPGGIGGNPLDGPYQNAGTVWKQKGCLFWTEQAETVAATADGGKYHCQRHQQNPIHTLDKTAQQQSHQQNH